MATIIDLQLPETPEGELPLEEYNQLYKIYTALKLAGNSLAEHIDSANPHPQYVLKAGDIMTGNLQVNATITAGDGIGTERINVNSAAGSIGRVGFQSNGSDRWVIGKGGGAESGADAGGPFSIVALNDSSVVIDTPFSILRAAGGAITLGRPLTTPQNVTLTAGRLFLPDGLENAPSITFANGKGIYASGTEDIMFSSGTESRVQFRLQASGNTGIEIGRVDGVASLVFYDFHTGATAVDRDARILVQNGTGVNEGARMDIYSSQLALGGADTVGAPTLVRVTDLDTGIHWPAADNIALVAGATIALQASTTSVNFPVGLDLGSSVASGPNDVSRHIALFGTTYGFNVTSNTLNHVANGTTQDFYTASVNRVRINASGLNVLSGTLSQGGVDALLDSDIGVTVQAYDAGLANLAAFNTNGFLVQTAVNTFVGRTITTPNAGLTTTNGAGTAGNVIINASDDLAALEALGSTGIAVRTAANTWAQRTITAGQNITVTNGNGVSGNPTVALDRELLFNSYAPTPAAVTSVTSIAHDGTARYIRIGDFCHVYGRVSVDPSVATGVVEFRLTLPIATNMTVNEQLQGNGIRDLTGALKEGWAIEADPTNDAAFFKGYVNSPNNIGISYEYSYQIL